MHPNWARPASSTTTYQLGLMLALVASSVTASAAHLGLDEKMQVLTPGLVDATISIQRDLTTHPQRASNSVPGDALAVAPADPRDWTATTKAVPGVLITGTFEGDLQARFLLRLPLISVSKQGLPRRADGRKDSGRQPCHAARSSSSASYVGRLVVGVLPTPDTPPAACKSVNRTMVTFCAPLAPPA